MFSLGFQLINGMMLGIEFPATIALDDLDEDDPEVTFAMVIDLLIVRLILFKYKPE